MNDNIVVGNTEAVWKCIAKDKLTYANGELTPNTTAGSYGVDFEAAAAIAEFLSEMKIDHARVASRFRSETRFTRSGMERKTTSDFGFIGWIIAQLNDD